MFEVRPKGYNGAYVSLSDEWIATTALRRGVTEQAIIDSLIEYRADVEGNYDVGMICNPEIQVPNLSDYLPTRKVDTVTRLTPEERQANKDEVAEEAKAQRERVKDVHAKLREQLGMPPVD